MILGLTQEIPGISGWMPEETPEQIRGVTSETCGETRGEVSHVETSEVTRGVTLGVTCVGVIHTVEEWIYGVTRASVLRTFAVVTITVVATTTDEGT